jgi:imidazolonepropionase-like amidohydrolase
MTGAGGKSMRRRIRIWAVILIGLAGGFAAPPAVAEEEILAIKAGRIVTAAGRILENGAILIREGKIAAIGGSIALPKGARIIDVSKNWVCPGFIDAFTNLGAADKETIEKDSDEATSPLTPHLRILDAIDPESPYIKMARRTGVTSVVSAPEIGNLLSGQGGLIRLDGADVEEMTIWFPVGVFGSLGEAPKRRYGPKGRMPMTRMGEAALLRQTFIEAQEYTEKFQAYEKKLKSGAEKAGAADKKAAPPETNLMLQALVSVLRGELPLVLNAGRMDDILTALRIAGEFHLKLILLGGADSHKVKETLAQKKIPVILRPRDAYRLRVETDGAAFSTAAALEKAGILFAFQTGSIQNIGGLIEEARQAVAHGLSEAEAFKALTLNPARIFGVGDKIGSLEKGKWADLVVFDRNPLAQTARVRLVVIRGRVVEDLR